MQGFTAIRIFTVCSHWHVHVCSPATPTSTQLAPNEYCDCVTASTQQVQHVHRIQGLAVALVIPCTFVMYSNVCLECTKSFSAIPKYPLKSSFFWMLLLGIGADVVSQETSSSSAGGGSCCCWPRNWMQLRAWCFFISRYRRDLREKQAIANIISKLKNTRFLASISLVCRCNLKYIRPSTVPLASQNDEHRGLEFTERLWENNPLSFGNFWPAL